MYGLIISLAILISALLGEKLAKDQKKDPEILWGALFWAVLAGVVGARIYHVIDYYQYYSEDWIRVFQLWKGGLGIIGGIALGGIAISIYLKSKKQNVSEWLNLAAVVLPLGQTIGRLGNFWNKELLDRAGFEMVFTLGMFVILWIGYKRSAFIKRHTFVMYLPAYVIIRIILSFL